MPMLGGPNIAPSQPIPQPQYGGGLAGAGANGARAQAGAMGPGDRYQGAPPANDPYNTGPIGGSYQYGSGAASASAANQSDMDAAKAARAAWEADPTPANAKALADASTKANNDSAWNPTPQFGGYAGGANDAANNYAGNAQGWAAATAPTTDLTNANQARGYGTGALGLDLAAAQGNAPSAAEAQFGKSLGQSIAAQAGAANSARGGGAGLAFAQRNAAAGGAAMSAQGAQDAAALRAQEMAAARGQLGQQAVAQQGLDAQTAMGLSNQQLEQEQIDQHGQLGFYQLANQAEIGQLQADTSRYTGNLQAATDANQLNSDNTWKTIGTIAQIGGAAAMAADLHLKEPEGPAHWSLREEPDFILARNERNGELRKVATEPLTPAERRQAEAPHGAGPLGSMDHPQTKTVGDLQLGGALSFRAHPSEGTKSGQRHAVSEGTKSNSAGRYDGLSLMRERM